jgi:hypothetical protein
LQKTTSKEFRDQISGLLLTLFSCKDLLAEKLCLGSGWMATKVGFVAKERAYGSMRMVTGLGKIGK